MTRVIRPRLIHSNLASVKRSLFITWRRQHVSDSESRYWMLLFALSGAGKEAPLRTARVHPLARRTPPCSCLSGSRADGSRLISVINAVAVADRGLQGGRRRRRRRCRRRSERARARVGGIPRGTSKSFVKVVRNPAQKAFA